MHVVMDVWWFPGVFLVNGANSGIVIKYISTI